MLSVKNATKTHYQLRQEINTDPKNRAGQNQSCHFANDVKLEQMKKLYLEFLAKLEMSLLGGSAFLRHWQSWAAFIGGRVGDGGLLGGR